MYNLKTEDIRMNTHTHTHTPQEASQDQINDKSIFKVVYAKHGEISYDNFYTFDEALSDFNAKKELDIQQAFDDRFVIHIENESGEIIYPLSNPNDEISECK